VPFIRTVIPHQIHDSTPETPYLQANRNSHNFLTHEGSSPPITELTLECEEPKNYSRQWEDQKVLPPMRRPESAAPTRKCCTKLTSPDSRDVCTLARTLLEKPPSIPRWDWTQYAHHKRKRVPPTTTPWSAPLRIPHRPAVRKNEWTDIRQVTKQPHNPLTWHQEGKRKRQTTQLQFFV